MDKIELYYNNLNVYRHESKIEKFLKAIGEKYFRTNVEAWEAYVIYPIIESPYLVIAGIKYPPTINIQDLFNSHVLSDFDGIDTYLFKEDITAEKMWLADGHIYYDDGYSFCICNQCGTIGIEFEGRSDRLPCKWKKFQPCKRSSHGDKGRTGECKFLLNAYRKAGIDIK